MTEKIFSKLQSILVENLSVSTEEVNIDANFRNDLGADSLDLVEIIMAVETEFDVEINDEEIMKIETVRNAVDILSSKIK
ncbi:acyl carrier protein [Clostridium sp. 'deep sea']|uniref:acyl carrier protein n=1 Tax=Clostridium sp. 'deep sea' TaxID=2779445 RepID=UPI0018964CD4|nr:acyl carrier protein [Clostridium sp. 'deep sea']QOR36077.1 acyl carrier protein [Clostridium sp. 'deep sea']